MFLDKCISLHEALKAETIEVSSGTDVAFSDVVDSLDETIEELEQKKAAQGQGPEEQPTEEEDN